MYYSNIIKKFRKKIIVAISMVCLILLSACGTKKTIEAEAQRIVEAIENKDMETVENIILGTENLAFDEELEGYFDNVETEDEGSGVIEKIVEQDSISIKEITEETIVYEISAPELSDMFQDAMREEDLSADNFEEYIYNYISTADKIKTEVEVPYIYEDEVFIADYSTQEFMDGITGNMITAYAELVQQMMSENSEDGVE